MAYETLLGSRRPKSSFEVFMETLPTIIAQYMQSAEQSAERDSIRAENKKLQEENQWLQQNVAFRSDLHTIYLNKVKELKDTGGKYEELAGRADKITDLNQTDEYTRVLGVEADNALTEISDDIKSFVGLIKEVDNRAQTISDRIDIIHGIGSELSRKVPTGKDGQVYPALWTRENVATAVDSIVTDPEFRNRYKALSPIDGSTDITNPSWLDDYITAIKNPGDPQLMEMNTNILQYFATELDYKTKASKEVEARIIGDPVVRQASLLNANQAALESFGNSLMMLNDFAFMYSKDLTIGEQYYGKIHGTSVNDPMSYMYKNVTLDKDQTKIATDIVREAGLLPKDKKASAEQIQELLMIKYKQDVAKASGLAMIVGPDRYLFTMHDKVGSTAAYASTLGDAMVAVDQYAKGLPQQTDGYKAHLTTFATHLGYSINSDLNKDGAIDSKDLSAWLLSGDPRANKVKEQIDSLIMGFAKDMMPLIGESAGKEILDTPFLQIINQMKEIENRIMKIQMGVSEEDFSNLQSQGKMNDGFNNDSGYNEVELANISTCVSEGGSWITGIGCTEYQALIGPELEDKTVIYPPTMNESTLTPKLN